MWIHLKMYPPFYDCELFYSYKRFANAVTVYTNSGLLSFIVFKLYT